ncbi:MAG: serine/threonine protein kinase [Prevotella sp.]|nr:serine/threonine protein kinase [Prevotella sp.]
MLSLQPNTTLQGGKYKIVRVLGQGGFGITYLAEQTLLQRHVAIKEFFMKDFSSRDEMSMDMQTVSTGAAIQVEQYRRKFLKEAQNLARLNHPNIVSVLEVFEENGTVYYSMPYLSGGSLYDHVKKYGVMSEANAMHYIRQIALALKYMHVEKHICHFDVKPQNIVLDSQGNAMLIDFGISKAYDATGHEVSMTPVGMSEGYAPIEQYQQNVDEFSPTSDVYALGATLYFLTHGERPVSAPNRASGTLLQVHENLSPYIKNIICTSMMISKRERPQDVDIFINSNGQYAPPYAHAMNGNSPGNGQYAPPYAHAMNGNSPGNGQYATPYAPAKNGNKTQMRNTKTSKSSKSYLWWILAILCAGLLAWLVVSQKVFSGATSVDEEEEEYVEQSKLNLYGYIGEYPVTMQIKIKGSQVKGTYYYNRQGSDRKLYLEGTYRRGKVHLDETTIDGKATGTFDGKLRKGVFTGVFTNYKGDELDFYMEE